jgi:DNA-directed RNA polymerase subunit beta
LYARAKKDKFQKVQEKDCLQRLDDKHNVSLNELRIILIDKLLKIIKDQVSAGVKVFMVKRLIGKGTKLQCFIEESRFCKS